jgi:hypothetical protein
MFMRRRSVLLLSLLALVLWLCFNSLTEQVKILKGKRNFFVTINESDKNGFHASSSEIDADGVVVGDERHHNTQIIPLIKGTPTPHASSSSYDTRSVVSSQTFSKTTTFESLRIAAFGSSKTWEPEVIIIGTPCSYLFGLYQTNVACCPL